MSYTDEEAGEAMERHAEFEVQRALKGLLRNLVNVRAQQSKGQGDQHRDGVTDGLNIAISAIRRRIR